jgi:D-xylose transport system substrate-binding protein
MPRLGSIFLKLMALLVAGLVLAACTGGAKVKVGVSFAAVDTVRWQSEQAMLVKMLEEKGYEVVSLVANHDARLQSDQVDDMVKQKVQAIILLPENGDALVGAVERAAEAGVRVLAYERLVKTPRVAAYLSFDNLEAGRQQALGLLAGFDLENRDQPVRLAFLSGLPSDNNAVLFRMGQDQALAPMLTAGTVKVVAEQSLQPLNLGDAKKRMQDLLDETKNKIDAVLIYDDEAAVQALEIIQKQQLPTPVWVAGQGLTIAGASAIARGDLALSIFKDTRDLPPSAVYLLDWVLTGQPVDDFTLEMYSLAALTNDETRTGEIPCLFLPIRAVTQANLFDEVVVSGYYAYDDIYLGLPENLRPFRP